MWHYNIDHRGLQFQWLLGWSHSAVSMATIGPQQPMEKRKVLPPPKYGLYPLKMKETWVPNGYSIDFSIGCRNYAVLVVFLHDCLFPVELPTFEGSWKS